MSKLDTVTIAEVNGKSVSLKDILKVTISNGNLGFIKDAIKTRLVKDAATAAGLKVSEEELQSAADRFRQKAGLQSADDTMRWMKDNFMSADDFEDHLKNNLLSRKLKQKIVGGHEEQYFAENSVEFQSAELSQIVTSNEGLANEIVSQIADEEEQFEVLAKRHSIDAASKPAGGYIGHVFRNKLSGTVQAAVFGANEGDIVGPIKTDQGFHVIRVEKLPDNVINERIKNIIAERLFVNHVADLYRKSVSDWTLLEAI